MGRLTKSINAMSARPGSSICGRRAGVTSRPSKKEDGHLGHFGEGVKKVRHLDFSR